MVLGVILGALLYGLRENFVGGRGRVPRIPEYATVWIGAHRGGWVALEAILTRGSRVFAQGTLIFAPFSALRLRRDKQRDVARNACKVTFEAGDAYNRVDCRHAHRPNRRTAQEPKPSQVLDTKQMHPNTLNERLRSGFTTTPASHLCAHDLCNIVDEKLDHQTRRAERRAICRRVEALVLKERGIVDHGLVREP